MVRRVLAGAAATALAAAALVGVSLPARAATVPGATNVVAVQTELHTISVTWDLPPADPDNPVLSVGVQWSDNAAPWGDWFYYPPGTTSLTHTIDYPEFTGVQVQFRVRVIYTSQEDSISAPSDPLIITGPPSPAQNVQQVDPGHGTVTLVWDPSTSDGGTPITAYQIYRRFGTENYSAQWFYLGSVAADEAPTFTDYLWGFGANEYKVLATNKWGSPWMDTQPTRGISWMPANAPERVTAKRLPGGMLRLTFTPGELRVDEFEGYLVSGGALTGTVVRWTPGKTPFVADYQATAGRRTTLHIRGWNRFKASAADYQLTVTPADKPGSPRGAKVTVSHQTATVSWRVPGIDGYSPITSYRVTLLSSGKTITVPAKARSAVFKRLAPGKYTFTIAAVNAVGQGIPATTKTVTVTAA